MFPAAQPPCVAIDGHSQTLTNVDMGPGEIREFCAVDDADRSLLRAATPAPRLRLGAGAGVRQLHMRARAYHRTLKLARTTRARAAAGARVADLIGAERIETAHLAEAIQCRPRWQV